MARTSRRTGSALLSLLASFGLASNAVLLADEIPSPIAMPTTVVAPTEMMPTGSSVSPVGPYAVSIFSPETATREPFQSPPYEVPGWFAAFEVGVIKPHVTNHVTSGTPVSPAFAVPVELPVPALDWTAAPQIELGYRLSEGRGDLRLGYRFIGADGSESTPGDNVESLLSLNVVDLDYVSSEWLTQNLCEGYRDLRFAFGVRVATSYLDSFESGISAEHFTSRFTGAGPHFGLEWSRCLAGSPMELYTRFDAAGLIGETRQTFGQFGTIRRDSPVSNGVEVVRAEIGLGWRPDDKGNSRFVLGYQFEQWWDLGSTDVSNFDLTLQGLFLRLEWRY